MIAGGQLSSTNAKKLLEHLWHEGVATEKRRPVADLTELARELNLIQESNENELAKVVDEVIAANPQAAADYKSGNARAFGALVGASMKATQGKGNPPLINKLLKERLDK
jgi:aspartyl-tRNA(Asn)/glutamyl-tRNA(Gln) amidotransferase subunit B